MSEREQELETALLGMKRRTLADGSPCFCFMWPDEEYRVETLLGAQPGTKGTNKNPAEGHGDHCLLARAALEPEINTNISEPAGKR